MKVILSNKAAQKISRIPPPGFRDAVPTIFYSRPLQQIQEHYHRDSNNVSVSFEELTVQSTDGRWGLGWYERDEVTENDIIQVNGIDLIFEPWGAKTTSTEALIDLVSNKFHVIYK